MKTVQFKSTVAILICIFFADVESVKASNYIPIGIAETKNLEKELYELLPGYVDGIFPRQEILSMGIPKSEIPPYWVQTIEMWLKRVLRTDYSPTPKTEIAMYGLPELRWKSDYIVGYYLTMPKDSNKQASRVEFQATDRHLSITIFMKEKVADINALSDDTILGILKKYMVVPKDKLPKISIEKTHKVLAGKPVCYGKMRCEFHELRDIGIEKEKELRWWSYIPFWISENRFFINVSTIDWEKSGRPVAANSILFKKNTGKDLKGLPTDVNEK